MSARTETVSPCLCGKWPSIHKKQAGRIFIYQISCICGRETHRSEDYSEVVEAWNDRDIKFPAGAQPPPIADASNIDPCNGNRPPGSCEPVAGGNFNPLNLV